MDEPRRHDPRIPYQNGIRGTISGYDGFISYSHALDSVLAPALQTGLERFAKPWYRTRALRIFRDTTNLAANPGLWTSIEETLAASAWLVLMASPRAAQSKWVNREVAWWLKYKSAQRLLVVLTEGEFTWADDAADGDEASAALPAALRGAFREEPHWVDLRWLHDVEQVDQSNPRLRDCVADIAAAVREVPKDELVGEHIRQHRRTMRLVRGAITTLAVLLTAAVVAAVVAVQQRDTAQRERDTAIFNQITAQTDRLRSTDASLAAQLDLTAYRLRPEDPDLATDLLTDANAVLSTPLTGHTDSVRAVAFSPDGHPLASSGDDQTVRLWGMNVDQAIRRICATTANTFTPVTWAQDVAPDRTRFRGTVRSHHHTGSATVSRGLAGSLTANTTTPEHHGHQTRHRLDLRLLQVHRRLAISSDRASPVTPTHDRRRARRTRRDTSRGRPPRGDRRCCR